MNKLRFLTLTALLLVSPMLAEPASIIFDTTPGGAGGTLTYDGLGGPLIGDDIVFVEIVGVDTPLNAGSVLTCVGCVLDFVTGANLTEGPALWTWDDGGVFLLTGSIPTIGIAAPAPLLIGTFVGTDNTPGVAGNDPNAFFLGVGTDEKHPLLTAYYGLSGVPFLFANTEIALGTFDELGDGAFSAIPNQADLINTAVPEPATLLLLGTGLVMAGVWRRNRPSRA